MNDDITLEVAYANPKKQIIISFQAPKDISVKEAIASSGILKQFNDLDLTTHQLGIFGTLTSLAAKHTHKDRIEIYPPLIADQKEILLKRAALSNPSERN